MNKRSILERPVWMAMALPRFPVLKHDLEVDVVVVGGGVTGITTAYLLSQEGVRVALIERERMAAADTARTTAHLTYVTDYRLHELVSKFGNDAARSFWQAGAAAIDQVENIIRKTQAECEFAWAPGYLYESSRSADKHERQRLQEDAQLAQGFGFDATLVDMVPYVGRSGVCFAHQAKLHPRKYLKALLAMIQHNGGHIFENTAFEEAADDPMAVRANGHTIRCQYLVIATHNPLMGKKGEITAALFQSKLALYTSYVLGARLPKASVPEALYWDTGNPYDYLRIDERRGHQYAIFGGEDVKTGQEANPEQVYQRLEERLRRLLPMATIEHRWMGQVIETDDGMPYIGENTERQFVATGFSGNGFTLGTFGAMMARDRYLNRTNPWAELFRVTRSAFHGGLWRYVRENLDYPYYMVRDWMAPAEGESVDDIKSGEGKIIRVAGKKVAAYRDAHGKPTLLSPVCTHLKCIVRWNNADRTWDCPCHGSRFHPTGEVLSGPAEEPLARLPPDVKHG
jgi:glycine/D-amino acid oxidase-like deaminating enzyme/nitrite reductase/ring-hydroxylating ferredoxin subunit